MAQFGNVTLTIQPSTSSMPPQTLQPRMRYNPAAAFQMGITDMMGDGPGRRLRKNVANVRRHVDYVSTVLNHTEARLWQYGRKQRVLQQPDILYQSTALPVHSTPDVPVDCVLTKFIRTAMNKVKCPVYSVAWSPEGKRLITGTQTGEFTLWNGTAFNFETILQAHDVAIRALKWSSNEQWLLSADQDGYVKYWQPNMNNAHMFAAHKDEAIRGIAFSPTDIKFATASDDGTAKIWDFARYTEDRVLRGHGSEVRAIDWHPTKGLVVTGSRDTQQPVKLWDPKSGSCLATLQEHKSSVMAVEFNQNGNWLLTGGRDHLLKMYDIRVMKEVHTYRAHKKEVISLAWHPVHEGLFVSGGGDGSIVYWMVDSEKEIGLLEHAHDQAIWSMKWHPMGHILATGSNDNNTKFWARNRPGDTVEDIFGLSTTISVGHLDKEREPRQIQQKITIDDTDLYTKDTFIPGMGLDDGLYEQISRDISVDSTLLFPDDLNRSQNGPMIGAKRTLIKQPPAKKAQRQFERMWNNSKGIGAGTDDFNAMIGGMGRDDGLAPSQNPIPSFLGPPSTGASLLGPSQPRPLPPSSSQLPSQQQHQPSPNQKNPEEFNSWRNPQFNNQKDSDDRRPPLPSSSSQMAPQPPAIKFDQNGMPIIPQGLPRHLWPMPPGMRPPGGPPPQNGPPPPMGNDIDYRSVPPPVNANGQKPPGGDIDLRGGGGGQRGPPQQQQQAPQQNWRLDPRSNGAPPNRPSSQQSQLPPQQIPPSNGGHPPGWMPQFETIGGPLSIGRGGPIRPGQQPPPQQQQRPPMGRGRNPPY